jgi:hypothetical protein
MNGITVKIIAVAMNKRRSQNRVFGRSSHSATVNKKMCNRECTLIDANQKEKIRVYSRLPSRSVGKAGALVVEIHLWSVPFEKNLHRAPPIASQDLAILA